MNDRVQRSIQIAFFVIFVGLCLFSSGHSDGFPQTFFPGLNNGLFAADCPHEEFITAGWFGGRISSVLNRYSSTQKNVIGLLILTPLLFFAYRLIFVRSVPKIRDEDEEEQSIRFDADELETLINERVEQRTKELKSQNQRLQEEVNQHPVKQGNLPHRLKHLNCLYGISRLVEQPEIPLEQVFQKAAYLLQEVYRHPDMMSVRITFDGINYETDNFEKSESSQYAQIKVDNDQSGSVKVYYTGEDSQSPEKDFSKAENDLVNAVAGRLGSFAEQKRFEERLKLFRELIDHSSDSIFIIEPKWGRLVDVNQTSCQMLGYSREELLHMTIKDIEEDLSDEASWSQLISELHNSGSLTKQGRQKRKDKTTFFVETSLNYVAQEKEELIIALARDITERKEAEQEQTRLIEKLKESTHKVENINKELKDFAYVISHDLKAPLRGIKTVAGWLSEDYGDKVDDEGKEQLNLLLSRVERMHNLIDGVLQYSRVDNDEMFEEWVDLQELIPKVVDMASPPDNIKVSIESKLPTIKCDKTRISQVFQNLLSNSIRYIDKDEGLIKIDCEAANDFWKFSIADNGCGIEENHFERIFRIFQTLSPKDKNESTGIGLTVVKKVVQLYGGKIWVDSKLGRGSTFFFTLPRRRKSTDKVGMTSEIKA